VKDTHRSKQGILQGTSLDEVKRIARREFHTIQKRTPRRQPYIRSQYSKKDKIFISQLWDHLDQKNRADQLRRLKLFNAAIDLLRNSTLDPLTSQNPNKPGESLHRFLGITKEGQPFYVQLKEVKKTGRKDFMSAFPVKSDK
jgi:hypothetical protein